MSICAFPHFAGRLSGNPPEMPVKGGKRGISHPSGNFRNRHIASPEQIDRRLDPDLIQIFKRRLAGRALKASPEAGDAPAAQGRKLTDAEVAYLMEETCGSEEFVRKTLEELGY